LVTALMIVIVIGVSALTYRYVEQPWRTRMRHALAVSTTATGQPAEQSLNRPVGK